MDQDSVDAAILCKQQQQQQQQKKKQQKSSCKNSAANLKINNNNINNSKRFPSIEALNSEMPYKNLQKNYCGGKKMLKTLLNRLRLKHCGSVQISKPDPTYRVAYLGNVVTGWAKGDGCVEKPLSTLWRNYTQSSRPDVRMQLTVSSGGLKVTTKDHGLTEYWAHRLTTCTAPKQFPRIFCWIYRHEGRRLRHELRCHAVLCSTQQQAKQIEYELKQSLRLALDEFKREKILKQNARLSLINSLYENPTIPRRKILLSTGGQNYRPPLERSKSAPKLTSIEEIIEEEEEVEQQQQQAGVVNNDKKINYKKILRHYDSTSALLDKRKDYLRILNKTYHQTQLVPVIKEICDDNNTENDDNNNNNNNDDKNIINNDNNVELIIDDEKSDLILDELMQNSLRNDLLETCERAWLKALNDTQHDSDDGSLSSGCESASTVTSNSEFPTITEEDDISDQQQQQQQQSLIKSPQKTDNIDFKVGGCVLSRARSFEKINNDLLKFSLLNNDQVSLIPIGETHSDFSSLKVYKKRNSIVENDRDGNLETDDDHENIDNNDDDRNSDESGYEEEEETITSSIANVVLI